MTTARTHYDILGIAPDATPEQIKQAYRRIVRAHHPDRDSQDNGEKFRAARSAYDQLIDPARRNQYDAQLEAARRPFVAPAATSLDDLPSWLFVAGATLLGAALGYKLWSTFRTH